MEWKKKLRHSTCAVLRYRILLSVQMRKTITHLLLQQTLDERRLKLPDLAEVSTGLQSVYPDRETETQGEGGADDNQPALRT
jgi:hypothetical protein